MNKKAVSLIIVLAAAAGGAYWYVNHQRADGAPAAAAGKPAATDGGAPTTVTVATAVRQDVAIMLAANGSVAPLRSVDLHPQTSATIKQVHIREGQSVNNGDVMFTLDDRNDRANLDKAEAQAARDQATLMDLMRQYKRSQELMAQKFIAQGAVDTLASQVDAQRALIQVDAAAVQSAKVMVSYNTIRAPMAGRVGAINVYPGSLVQPTLSLATVTQLDPISVSFTLPETSLQALLDAQKAGPVKVQASAPNGAKGLEGVLSFVDNSVDPQAGVIRVKAQFDNRATTLWPGQYVNTQVTVQTLKDAVVVPLSAVITSTKGKLVYTVGPDQTAKAYPVVVQYAFGNNAAVTGLAGGEKVIVDGKQNLRPGGKIRDAGAGKPGNGKGPAAGGLVASAGASANAAASKGRAE